MIQMVGAVAEFERAMMLERQREGFTMANAEGEYQGRAKTAHAKAGKFEAALKAGEAPAEIARKLAISRSSVYRIMDDSGIRRKMIVA